MDLISPRSFVGLRWRVGAVVSGVSEPGSRGQCSDPDVPDACRRPTDPQEALTSVKFKREMAPEGTVQPAS